MFHSPVSHHQNAGAVGHQDHRAVDLFQLLLDRPDPGRAVEFVGFKWRNATYLAQAGLQQCLPMLGHVLTQARHDQNGCGSLQLVHLNTLGFSKTRLARWPELFCSTDLKDPPSGALFI
ncbi:hypothetical protein D3C71_1763810 [compost metagenome]